MASTESCLPARPRWNQLDLAIVLLSIMGITLEEIEMNAALPINPTIIRIMRVLRIARGRPPACPTRVSGLSGGQVDRAQVSTYPVSFLNPHWCVMLVTGSGGTGGPGLASPTPSPLMLGSRP